MDTTDRNQATNHPEGEVMPTAANNHVIRAYSLKMSDKQTIKIPKGANILSVADQFGAMHCWALVNPEAEEVSRLILMLDTGERLPPEAAFGFVGTVIRNSGYQVLHVFCEVD